MSRRELAEDVGCSWREVYANCHVDPDATSRYDGGDSDE